jgi:CheY-like chemotaxis protein
VLDRQVKQMTRLIDDLLDLSRISHGKLELRRESVTLRAIVESAVEITRTAIEALGHELEIDLPLEPVHLDADPTRLAQVFSNLLHNAAKYTEPGGRIVLDARRDGEHVTVRVRDNGIGIAPENLERVFEMFTQVGRSLEQSRGGLGVGLSLAQWLVRLHGGSLRASSDGLGCGSEFAVNLPVSSGDPKSQTGPDSAGGGENNAARRVLIVDDNRDFADSLGAMLGMAGHEVRISYDGPEAIAAARMWQPEIVLLDIGLPQMNGYEVARRIREVLADDPLLVAITGWGQAEDRRRSRAAGFDHHFVKPVDPGALNDLIAVSSKLREDERWAAPDKARSAAEGRA